MAGDLIPEPRGFPSPFEPTPPGCEGWEEFDAVVVDCCTVALSQASARLFAKRGGYYYEHWDEL